MTTAEQIKADNLAYYNGLCLRAGVSPSLKLPIHVLITMHTAKNPKMALSYRK